MNALLKTPERNLAPQLEKQRKRRRRAAIVGGGMLVVLGAVMFESKPALYEISKWRARRFAAKAEVDIAAEDWQNAQIKAQMAYQIRPEEPSAIRVVARLQSLTGNAAAAIQFWDQLKKASALTLSDQRMRAEDLLRMGLLAEARAEVDRLLGEAPNDGANLRLAAKWAASDKKPEEAVEFAARAQKLEPGNAQGKLLLGLLQNESLQPATRQAGIQTLLELADGRSKPSLEALIFLASRRELPTDKIETVISSLREHPLAAENHRLLALELELSFRSGEREAVLDAAMQHYGAADPAAQRIFGVWLNAHKEYERTLHLFPLAEALKRKDFLLVTLDAMAAQKRWMEIDEILQGGQAPLDEVYSELFLARSSMELGRVTSTDLHWRRAHVAAAASSEQMWFLGSYAEKIGQSDQAELAYRSLTSNAATARPAYEGLLRLAEKRRDTEAVRELLAEMAKRWPKDASVINDFTYFNLLRGYDLDEGLKVARELVAQAPASLAHRTTLALANVRLKDPSGAMAVYRGLNVPWDRAAPSHRAVYAAALGLNGNLTEARAQAGAIAVDLLREEERLLITPWRTQ